MSFNNQYELYMKQVNRAIDGILADAIPPMTSMDRAIRLLGTACETNLRAMEFVGIGDARAAIDAAKMTDDKIRYVMQILGDMRNEGKK